MDYNLPIIKTCTYGDMFLRFVDKIKMVNILLIEEVIMNQIIIVVKVVTF